MKLQRQKQLVHWFFMFTKLVQIIVQVTVLSFAIEALIQGNESIIALYCIISLLYLIANFGLALLYLREENAILITEPLYLLILVIYIPVIIGLTLSNLKRLRGKRSVTSELDENSSKLESAIIDIIIATVVVMLIQIIITGIVMCTNKIVKKINEEENIALEIIRKRQIVEEELLIDHSAANSKVSDKDEEEIVTSSPRKEKFT